jgi:hypothetical protein
MYIGINVPTMEGGSKKQANTETKKKKHRTFV